MLEDAELLRRYAESHAEDAFAELVRRRIDLVYSVALRQVGGDAHLAKDVAQKVFVDLARKAPSLVGRPVLSGGLCRSTQYAASDVVRAERRRRAREQRSWELEEITAAPVNDADWDKVRPLLDQALADLTEEDRDAVALRFFENRPFAEIGRRLRLTDDAARKRVERALAKLSTALSRRGVTSTLAALGAALSSHAGTIAPSGLATAVTATAVTSGGVATLGLCLLGWSGAAKAGVGALAAAAAVAAGWGWTESRAAAAERAALLEAREEAADLRDELRAARGQLTVAMRRADAAEEDNVRLLRAIADAGRGRTESLASTAEAMRDTVEARYNRAIALARAGDFAAALPELLWCYDDGMRLNPSYSGTRMSVLLSEIARMGQQYPPALAALHARRDAAERRLGGGTDAAAAQEFASLNRVLGEERRTLALYDSFNKDDPRRRQLLMAGTYNLLLEARRYADALQAVPYERIVPSFEEMSRPPNVSNEKYPDLALRSHRQNVVANAAKKVEVLAGTGNLQRAREFADRVLQFDGSTETRELLRRHVARAGHPQLFDH